MVRGMVSEMVEKEPVSAQPIGAADAPLPPWAEARSRLEEAQFYWLATVRPDGRPHVMPVLAIWLDGALHFSTGPASHKGKNLAGDSNCVITVDSDDLHLVVEGNAAKVSAEARLQRVAAAYASKYGWQVAVRNGAFHDADGAPTAGPPPYEVYEVTPTTIFAFGTDESFGAARWRF
jgi:nitroimidazol reductase NimA-like FMN-containing flavoprotein (pyridoxamine 5'-phosphate oxidase superfamily)